MGERLHVEVRGLGPEVDADADGRRRLAAGVEAELGGVEGVRWAVANPVLGRVVVSMAPAAGEAAPTAVPPEIMAAIERAEAAAGATGRRLPPDMPEHPADREPAWRALTALVADSVGLGLGLVGSAIRRSPLPADLAAIAGLADSEPHIRSWVTDIVGPTAADLALALTNATSQGLAQGPIGVLSDLVWRAASFAEVSARRDRWAQAELDLCHRPELAAGPFVDARRRPVPMPPGAVERYADRAIVAGAAAGVAAAVASGQVSRTAAGLYAGLPKAARLGREVFAVHVDRRVSSRGGVVLDADALRRLDRVDTVVVDATAGGAGRNGRGQASPPWAVSVVAAARRAGHMVVVAGDVTTARNLGADLRVAGGDSLAEDVRDLQADGCVVLLVCGGGPSTGDACWAADVAIGVWEPAGRSRRPPPPVPWAADVISPPGDAWWLVEASATAGQVVRQSVAIAVVGAATSSTVVFARPRSARYGWAVNAAAMLAMANATRVAVSLAHRAEPEGVRVVPPWHALGGDEVLGLVASTSAGLSAGQAAERVPPGRRPPPPVVRLVGAIGEELANPLTPVLAAGAALSAALGGVVDAGIVAGVTTANAVLGGLQRWRTEQAADSLAQAGDVTVHVRREGVLCPIGTREVVVGDVVVLRAGDVVPADARILEADGVLADESSLTGESLPVAKFAHPTDAQTVADRHSMLYGDTSVAAGEAVAVVVATGVATEAGAAMTGDRLTAGGVEARLGELTGRAIPVSLAAGAAVVAAGVLRGRPVATSLANGVSLAVAAVPEGLPLVATMAQLSAAGRLARQGALVRNHRAIEALGRVDVLCTDKTGTLTIGRLAVRAVSDLYGDADLDTLAASHRMVLGAALRATPAPEEGRRLAHPTDASVVSAAEGSGVGQSEGHSSWTRTDELPFEPAQGFHATFGRAGRRRVVSVKGAPEVVLPRCTQVWRPGVPGESDKVSEDVLADVHARIERLARRGLRVLAVAEAEAGARSAAAMGPEPVGEEGVNDLTLLGLVAIADPVRPEAASAVQGMQKAGVRVCMVTGDHPSTAEGIAAELGILDGHRVMGGGELATLADADLDERIDAVSVFARVTPADKVRIVQSFQRIGRVVAMTGDGANDAAAIRLADVGVAMGSRSTPAARQAADVIVTNEDIETIIAAVVEGRALWGSVRDALAILLGGNLGEIGFTLAGAMMSGTAPLNARQLLLVNLMTDVAPALAIATRPPARRRAEELLGEGPERSLGRPLERAILGRAVVTALGASVAWVPARLTGGPRRASTVALVALVGTQLTQTMITGGRHPVVWAAGLGSAAVLVGIVQTPGVSRLFGCVPLDPVAWSQVGTGVAVATGVSVARPVAVRMGALALAGLAGLARRLEAEPESPATDGSGGPGIRTGQSEIVPLQREDEEVRSA